MGESRTSRVDPLSGAWLVRPGLEEEAIILAVDCHLHSEADSICPRCLGWIEEREFVRQTAYGLMQHEVCPPFA